MTKTLAILAYIDDTPTMMEEFGWLYRSWIYSGNWRTSDIVAVCNPSVIPKLPQDPGVIYIPCAPMNVPGTIWENYAYINSTTCLVGEHTAHLPEKYTHILRTDADVFLAPALADLRPSFYVFGRGRYVQMPETGNILADFARHHGFEYHNVHNVGSAMLGPAAGVLSFLADQGEVCATFLRSFGDNAGEWPLWWRGVSLLYAGEIVANHRYYEYLHSAYMNMLDYESYSDADIVASHIAHIHAFHTDDYWSKFVFREGGYAQLPTENLDITRTGNYCHWIATTPTETVKKLCNYPY